MAKFQPRDLKKWFKRLCLSFCFRYMRNDCLRQQALSLKDIMI